MVQAQWSRPRVVACSALVVASSITALVLRPANPLAAQLIQHTLSLCAVAFAIRGTRRMIPSHRWAFSAIVAAIGLWSAGDVVWSILEAVSGERPTTSIADVLYLAGYPAMATGLGLMAHNRSRLRSQRGLLLDATAMSAAAALATWLYLVAPSIEGVGGLTRIVYASYPLADVIVLSALVIVAFAPGRRTTPTFVMAAGLLMLLVVDFAYALAANSGNHAWLLDVLDAFYPVSYMLVAAALCHRDASEFIDPIPLTFRRIHPARLAFLGLALFTPPLLNTFDTYASGAGQSRHEKVLIFATLGIGLVVYLRLGGLVHDHERSQDNLAHLASHDGLTGLVNRKHLLTRIEYAIAAATATRNVAVLYLDLDRFKAVNDTRGHDAGDALLRQVAERLRLVVRNADVVSRLGGDEFAILCPDVDHEATAYTIADRVVAELARPFDLDDGSVIVSCSIGVAFVRNSTDSADALLNDADAAMYQAKNTGRDRWTVFDDSMRQAQAQRRGMELALQRSLRRSELRLEYQPIVSLTNGRTIAFEALARWDRPRAGVVPPSEFIALAEETGLIVPIGTWVLHEAIAELGRLNAQRDTTEQLRMNVNVSGRQLDQADFPSVVQDAIARAGVAPDLITLEVTESVVIADTEWMLTQLNALKAIGVRLAIDDFGTGYSSLAYLRTFPFDVVKLDRDFLSDILENPKTQVVVKSVVALVHAIGMTVVAEGIEEQLQSDRVVAMHCDAAQGYFFGHPMRPNAAQEHLDGERCSSIAT